MAQFFNSTQKTPYLKVETLDGTVKLGLNKPVTLPGDFNDVISLTECKIDVRSDVIMIEVAIEILAGAWTDRSFDDVLEPLIEEPYRTSPQRPEDSNHEQLDKTRGIWNIQFGWRNQDGEDELSEEIQCITVQNDVSILPEARGAVQLRKKMIMLPSVYLSQTMIVELVNVQKYLSEQTTARENDAQTGIIPSKVFDLLVQDLIAIHGSDAQGLPKLRHFVAAGDNFLNVNARTAYDEWLQKPLTNITSINQVMTSEKKDTTPVTRWLFDWLGDNDMEIFLMPLRKFNGGLGFLIRYAPEPGSHGHDKLGVTNTYQVSLDPKLKTESTYRYAWRPSLSIRARDSILENASFSYQSGQRSAGYIESLLKYKASLNSSDNRSEEQQSTDAQTEVQETLSTNTINPRSLFMEALKFPNKQAAITVMGQPKIAIMDLISIDATNPLFDGIYEILGIAHMITNQGFSTDIDCIQIVEETLTATPAGIERGEIQ